MVKVVGDLYGLGECGRVGRLRDRLRDCRWSCREAGHVGRLVLVWDGVGDALVMVGGLKVVVVVEVVVDGCFVGLSVVTC